MGQKQLVGRTEEVAILAEVFDRARRRTSQLALIEGEAGIGKTRVLRDVLGQARSAGFAVVEGAAEELWTDRPLAPLLSALGLEEQRSQDGSAAAVESGSPFTGMDEIVERIERAARDAPLVLAIEDLHWADAATLRTLAAVHSRLSDRQLALIGTLRPGRQDGTHAWLRTAAEGARGELVSLGPLDTEAVAHLASLVVGAPPGPILLRALGAAGGNPLFVTELLHAVMQEGGILRQGELAESRLPTLLLPLSLRMVILRQLATLSDPALAILRVAAALGSPFSVLDLHRVLDRRPTDLMEALAEPIEAGVLAEAGERLVFRHELVREALYLDVAASARSAVHRQIAEALAEANAPAAIVAHHFTLSGVGDRRAFNWLIQAAREASFAPETAAGLYERALELTPPGIDPSEIDRVTAELVDAELWSGRISDGQMRAHAVLEWCTEIGLSQTLRLTLIRALLIGGRFEDALAEVALAREALAGDATGLARLDLDESFVRMFAGDLVAARGLVERARDKVPDDDASLVHLAAGIVAFFVGDVGDAVRLLRLAVATAGAIRSRRQAGAPHIFLGTALIEADQLDDARRMLAEGQRLDERGFAWYVALSHFQLGLEEFAAGDWDEAVAELRTGRAASAEYPGIGVGVAALGLLAVIATHRADLPAAKAALAAAHAAMAEGSRFGFDFAGWGTSLVLEAQGDLAGALEALETVWQVSLRLGLGSQYVRLGPDLARLAVAVGRDDLALSVADALEYAAGRNPTATWRGAALLCRGLASRDRSALAAAVDAFQSSPRRLERACAMLEAGVAVAAADRADAAANWIQDAIPQFERVGAHRDLARAHAALRSMGVRAGRRGPRRRPPSGWGSLTDTERRVVDLVAQGLTNPEVGRQLFTSRRTVETHLAHVFAKLGISSRVQLAAEVARQAALAHPGR